jgi:hypothetical protein
MIAWRVCGRSGCGRLQPENFCQEHRPKRPSAASRGYGSRHRKLRARWAARVAAGGVACARCGRLIEPGEPFDLGHSDEDRSQYVGPEHRACNRGLGRTGPRSTWWRE